MPKRTNEFQRLIFLVKKHAASGATVTESKLLKDLITGTEREVDICVESDVAGHHVIVSIECNARGRKASVQWVEELAKKHERLPTSVLVLVSRAGFSKEAGKVAAAYGIHTLSLTMVTDTFTQRLFGSASSLWSKAFTLTPRKVVAKVASVSDLPQEDVVLSFTNFIHAANGNELGTAKDLVEIMLKSNVAAQKFHEQGDESHKSFEIEWTPPQDDHAIYLKRLEPNVLRRIELVRVVGDCNFNISEFQLNHGVLGEIRIAWGTGYLLGKKTLVVASENEIGTQVSISTDE